MCKLKSMIALKGRIYMADADSHSDMLNELGISDDYLGASKKFVRLELSPEDGDPFSDVDTWTLKVDQDIKPDWYSDEEYKPMAVEAVKEWAKKHIFVGVDGLKLNTGTNYYIKDCKDVEITGSASVKAWDSASVKACGSAIVFNSTCFYWKKQSSLVLYENATFKDNIGKVIYQSGDFKLVSVESGKTVSELAKGC